MYRARIVPPGRKPAHAIGIGSEVDYVTDRGQARTVRLVLPAEADISAGRSPSSHLSGPRSSACRPGQSFGWTGPERPCPEPDGAGRQAAGALKQHARQACPLGFACRRASCEAGARCRVPPRSAGFLIAFLLPCLAGAAGGYLFHRLGMPAAWMSGALVVATLMALLGLRVEVPGPIATATFLLLGAIMGTAVTPETLRLMRSWPVSMAGLAVLVPGIIAGIAVYLQRVEGMNRHTSFFASIPGALSYVMAMTLASPADTRSVAVIQSVRLLLLMAVLPGLLTIAGMGATPVPASAPAAPGSWTELLMLLVLSVSCGLGMERLGVPGGATVGAMFASAILHGSEW